MGLVVFWGLVLGILGMLLAPVARRLSRGPKSDGENGIVRLEDIREPSKEGEDGQG